MFVVQTGKIGMIEFQQYYGLIGQPQRNSTSTLHFSQFTGKRLWCLHNSLIQVCTLHISNTCQRKNQFRRDSCSYKRLKRPGFQQTSISHLRKQGKNLGMTDTLRLKYLRKETRSYSMIVGPKSILATCACIGWDHLQLRRSDPQEQSDLRNWMVCCDQDG